MPCGVAWHGMAWHGTVRYMGMVWYVAWSVTSTHLKLMVRRLIGEDVPQGSRWCPLMQIPMLARSAAASACLGKTPAQFRQLTAAECWALGTVPTTPATAKSSGLTSQSLVVMPQAGC